MLSLSLGLIVGFAAGYGVRELISRRRRAAAREKWLKEQEEKLTKESFHLVH
jgi:hypothetical protein